MASWREKRQQWADSREEAQNNASDPATGSDERNPSSMWPFLLAAGLVVALLAWIVLASIFSPAEKNVTQAQLLTDSITDFVDAQNTGDAAALRASTCPSQVAQLVPGSDAEYSAERASEIGKNGKIVVDGVPSDYDINGDRGVVTVPTKLEKSGETANDQWKFVRVDEKWLVCNV